MKFTFRHDFGPCKTGGLDFWSHCGPTKIQTPGVRIPRGNEPRGKPKPFTRVHRWVSGPQKTSHVLAKEAQGLVRCTNKCGTYTTKTTSPSSSASLRPRQRHKHAPTTTPTRLTPSTRTRITTRPSRRFAHIHRRFGLLNRLPRLEQGSSPLKPSSSRAQAPSALLEQGSSLLQARQAGA